MVFLEIAGGMLFAPFITLLVVILLLASMGKSFGIRKAYVQLLLRLFEVSFKRKTKTADELGKHPSQLVNCVTMGKFVDLFIVRDDDVKMRRH